MEKGNYPHHISDVSAVGKKRKSKQKRIEKKNLIFLSASNRIIQFRKNSLRISFFLIVFFNGGFKPCTCIAILRIRNHDLLIYFNHGTAVKYYSFICIFVNDLSAVPDPVHKDGLSRRLVVKQMVVWMPFLLVSWLAKYPVAVWWAVGTPIPSSMSILE